MNLSELPEGLLRPVRLPGAQDKSGKVEKLRLEVDSRRRTVAELDTRVDAARSRLEGHAGDNKVRAQLEGLTAKLQHKEEKLAGRGEGRGARGLRVCEPSGWCSVLHQS
jgi:hypothetical protein